jgi:hypothetical protein
MKFSVSKEVVQMLALLEQSPRVRRLIYGAEAVVGLFALAALIHAVRWW